MTRPQANVDLKLFAGNDRWLREAVKTARSGSRVSTGLKAGVNERARQETLRGRFAGLQAD
jgi:hypothetical protein